MIVKLKDLKREVLVFWEEYEQFAILAINHIASNSSDFYSKLEAGFISGYIFKVINDISDEMVGEIHLIPEENDVWDLIGHYYQREKNQERFLFPKKEVLSTGKVKIYTNSLYYHSVWKDKVQYVETGAKL